MAIKVQKPADTRFAKALMFSPPGHGKTTFLGTAQEDDRTAPMLLLDFEGGEESLAGLDIDVIRIRNWDDYNESFELLTSEEGEKYKSLGLDSISETHIWALLERIGAKGDSRNDPDLIEQGDYGVVSTQMRRLLREFRDLPLHVFYTANSKEIEVRGEGKVQVPKMAGQMAEEVVALVSVCGYLAKFEEDGEVGRELVLQNVPGFRTKARTPWKVQAPDTIENPTVTTFLDALEIKASSSRRRSSKKKED
jgi:hypothetical protein